MKEVIFVLLDQWADFESAFLNVALNSGVKPDNNTIKYKVKTLSITKEPVRSIGGFSTHIDYDIHSLPDNYEALILVGGMSWFTEDAKLLLPLVEKTIKDNKILGAICNASVFLGIHGFLNKVKHTSNTLDYLKGLADDSYTNEEGYLNQQAVSDRKIVTANGTGYLEFTKELLLLLDVDTPQAVEEYYNFNKLGLVELMKLKG